MRTMLAAAVAGAGLAGCAAVLPASPRPAADPAATGARSSVGPEVLAEQGCRPAGLASWAIRAGRGPTVEAALADLGRHISAAGLGRPVTWTKLSTASPDGRTSTWLLSVGGRARLTALIEHATDAEVTATPDVPCA